MAALHYADAMQDPIAADAAGEFETEVSPPLRATITAADVGERLDKVLARLFPQFSRSRLKAWCEAGHVRLDGQAAVVRSKPRCGSVVELQLPPDPEAAAFAAQAIELPLVWSDAELAVIDKPAGLVVHPAAGNWSGTLLNGLLWHFPETAALPRAGIVHRLDKDTSGLMVVAKTREVMDALVRAIAAREVSRQYLALAHGTWVGARHRTVDAPIGRDPRNRLRMAVVDLASQSGKTARTDFELLASDVQSCFVRCVLHTGRTHQIRVHMESIGHPLIADSVYGGTPQYGMERQALHATRLAFVHPASGMPVSWEAPLPHDMQGGLAHFGPALQSSAA